MSSAAPRTALFLIFAALCAPAVAAQSFPSKIDPGHSYATLWMGRDTEVSAAVNTGVGQVGGTAELANPATPPSALEFALVPGGNGAVLLTRQGTLRSNQIAAIIRYTVMSFHSTAIRVRRDGRLELAGDLTVTHVTRELEMGRWSWAYSGSTTYSEPQSKTITRPAKFVVMSPHAEFLPTYLKDEKEIIVAATMEAHDFPELPDHPRFRLAHGCRRRELPTAAGRGPAQRLRRGDLQRQGHQRDQPGERASLLQRGLLRDAPLRGSRGWPCDHRAPSEAHSLYCRRASSPKVARPGFRSAGLAADP